LPDSRQPLYLLLRVGQDVQQLINAIQSEDDRERVMLRIQELSGAIEQSPEEVELILLTLTVELWELRARTVVLAELSAPTQHARAT